MYACLSLAFDGKELVMKKPGATIPASALRSPWCRPHAIIEIGNVGIDSGSTRRRLWCRSYPAGWCLDAIDVVPRYIARAPSGLPGRLP